MVGKAIWNAGNYSISLMAKYNRDNNEVVYAIALIKNAIVHWCGQEMLNRMQEGFNESYHLETYDESSIHYRLDTTCD